MKTTLAAKLKRTLLAETKLRTKVHRIYRKVFGKRAERLLFFDHSSDSNTAVEAAFLRELGRKKADELGFHAWDWREDAAFMVALHLFPERFTPAEIRKGIDACACHASYHVNGMAESLGYDRVRRRSTTPRLFYSRDT